MMEAALMGGGQLGPLSPWVFVGATSLLSTGSVPIEIPFPTGIQPGDLAIAVLSPMSETIKTSMTSQGWQHFTPGIQDYACAARYEVGLAPPKWEKAASNPVGVSVLVFRASGWSSVQLESHVSPAQPIDITTRATNELLLSIGITPKTTSAWVGHMTGAEQTERVTRALAPALQIYSANVDKPKTVTGIYVDAPSGEERNLIISAY